MSPEPALSFDEKYFPFSNDCYPEQMIRNSAFIIAAVVAAIFASPLAYVFMIAASSQLLIVCALKIYRQYDEDAASQIQLKALDFQTNYPFLQIVAFISILAFFFVFPLLSGALGGLLGIYVGLLSSSSYYKKLQTISDDF